MTPNEIIQKILEIVKDIFPESETERIFRLSPDELKEKNLVEELNLDSLDVLLLEMHLEREFGVSFSYEESKFSLGKAAEFICRKTKQ